MGGNLSTLGFVFESEEEYFEDMARLATEARQRLAVSPGDYAIWRSRTGAEIWFHLGGTRLADGTLSVDEILGLSPFFGDGADVQIRLERQVLRPDDNAFEGAFAGWVDPDRQGETLAYPLVFDAVDFAAHASRAPPLTVSVRLCGFVRTIAVYADDAAFLAAGSETAGLSPRSVLPIGLLSAAASGKLLETPMIPSSHVLVNGVVSDHAILRNETTGIDFHKFAVVSDQATYVMVADAERMPASFEDGMIASVACWLMGRIMDDH